MEKQLADEKLLINVENEKMTDKLIITNKIVRYKDKLYPLKNISRIGMYKEKKKNIAWYLTLFLVSLAIGMINLNDAISNNFYIQSYDYMLIVLSFGVVMYSLFKLNEPPKIGFGIKTNSGEELFFSTYNEIFINELIDNIQHILEHEDITVSYDVNIQNKTITKSDTINTTNIKE
jgi:hypothetical protein